MWVLGAVMLTTAAGIGLDVWRGSEPPAELTEVPLMAAVFVAMAWHAHRKQAADRATRLIGEQNARLLATQRQFLQDAAHQLRTPITIALGHAELLAGDLTGQQQGQDIQVVIGELSRLRRIAERLLLIAAAGDPGFLHAEVVALDRLIMELIRRWRPTADRSWQLGRLDPVTVRADRERLGLALDALLENAVRHTGDRQCHTVVCHQGLARACRCASSSRTAAAAFPADRLPLIFDRFRTGDGARVTGNRPGAPPRPRGSPRARRRRDGPQQARLGQRIRADLAGAAQRAAGAAGRFRRHGGGRGARGGRGRRRTRPVRGRRPRARAARECQAMTVKER